MVLLSAEDLDSLEATIELLADQDAVARVREAEAAVAAGQLTTMDEMAALMHSVASPHVTREPGPLYRVVLAPVRDAR